MSFFDFFKQANINWDVQRMGYSKVNNIGGIAAYSGKVEK